MSLIPKNRDHGWVPYVWLVFLAFFILPGVFDPHATAKSILVTLAATAIFLVLYFRVFWTGPPWNYLLIACMAGMGIGLGHINPGACVFIIYTSSFVPWAMPKPRWAFGGIAALVAALAVDAAFFHAPGAFWVPAMIVSIGVGLSNTYFAEKNRSNIKLRMAQEEIEHLAKVAERERIARDLHDVLGHTLSLIIINSTVAGKLFEKNPEKAKLAIANIEKVSRDAMAEIRATLRGYSMYKLSEEIQRAKHALGSAGIGAESEATEVDLSPSQESVMALIVREAVTNVVRHSHAHNCRLKLAAENGSCVLSVEDDGSGGIQTEGNGLRGMRERIEALGGTMNYETTSGTKLKFAFPLAGNGTH